MQKDVETVTLRVNAQFVFRPFPGRKQNFPFKLTHPSGVQAPALQAWKERWGSKRKIYQILAPAAKVH